MREVKQESALIYILGNLVGLSNGRLISKRAKYPKLEQVFPDLFTEDKTQSSVDNFMAFAKSHNSKIKR